MNNVLRKPEYAVGYLKQRPFMTKWLHFYNSLSSSDTVYFQSDPDLCDHLETDC